MDHEASLVMFVDSMYKAVVFKGDPTREEWLKSLALKEMHAR